MNGKTAYKLRKFALQSFNPERRNNLAINPIKNWIRFIKKQYTLGYLMKG